MILGWVRDGVKIRDKLDGSYVRRIGKNIINNQKEHVWIQQEVKRRLACGQIKEVLYTPKVVNPIFVRPKPGPKKYRMIIDMRAPNEFYHKRPFKLENLRTMGFMVKPGEFMFSLDLEDGYHHVLMHESIRHITVFSFEGVLYECVTMPFGWRLSAWIFTKLGKVLLRRWREQGIRVVIYIDDIWVVCRDHSRAVYVRDNIIIPDLKALGWVISVKKSQLIPTTRIGILGMIIDTKAMKFVVTTKRRKKIRQTLKSTLTKNKNRTLRARDLASLTGRVASVQLAFPMGRLLNREMNSILGFRAKQQWDNKVTLTPQAIQDINEMLVIFNDQVEYHIRLPQTVSQIQVWSDASKTGWGAHFQGHKAVGWWSPQEQLESSTWRELEGIRLALVSLQNQLAHKRIDWFGDSQAARDAWYNWGSSVPKITQIVRKIHRWSTQNDTIINKAVWVPREENDEADALSKWKDHTEWKVQDWVFQKASRVFSPPQVDRFAMPKNAKTPRFNTLFDALGSEAIDAFTQDWTNQLNWVACPFSLIPQVLQLLRQQKAQAIMVVPHWPAQKWWPIMMRMSQGAFQIGNANQALENTVSLKAEPFKNPAWKFLVVMVHGALWSTSEIS